LLSVQLIRFGIVGLASNASLYLLYLLLTASGVQYLLAVIVSYGIGIVISFASNRSWTFGFRAPGHAAFVKFVSAYLGGLVLNLLLLYLLVDRLGLSHQVCQGVLILLFAGTFFLLQKFWIFNAKKGHVDGRSREA
jgi:putative flippase GtrA